MHPPLILGIVLMSAAAGLDIVVRLRLRKAGEKDVFIRGITIDYRRYLRVRGRFGWSGWPLFVVPPLFVSGLALILVWLVNP